MKLAEMYGMYAGDFATGQMPGFAPYEVHYRGHQITLPPRMQDRLCIFEGDRETTFERAWAKIQSM